MTTESPAPAEDLGLPGWLNDMLQPGVGQGIFMTLKVSLVGLVLTLGALLMYIEDEVRAAARPCFTMHAWPHGPTRDDDEHAARHPARTRPKFCAAL